VFESAAVQVDTMTPAALQAAQPACSGDAAVAEKLFTAVVVEVKQPVESQVASCHLSRVIQGYFSFFFFR
jgi:hypothetical protein